MFHVRARRSPRCQFVEVRGRTSAACGHRASLNRRRRMHICWSDFENATFACPLSVAQVRQRLKAENYKAGRISQLLKATRPNPEQQTTSQDVPVEATASTDLGGALCFYSLWRPIGFVFSHETLKAESMSERHELCCPAASLPARRWRRWSRKAQRTSTSNNLQGLLRPCWVPFFVEASGKGSQALVGPAMPILRRWKDGNSVPVSQRQERRQQGLENFQGQLRAGQLRLQRCADESTRGVEGQVPHRGVERKARRAKAKKTATQSRGVRAATGYCRSLESSSGGP